MNAAALRRAGSQLSTQPGPGAARSRPRAGLGCRPRRPKGLEAGPRGPGAAPRGAVPRPAPGATGAAGVEPTLAGRRTGGHAACPATLRGRWARTTCPQTHSASPGGCCSLAACPAPRIGARPWAPRCQEHCRGGQGLAMGPALMLKGTLMPGAPAPPSSCLGVSAATCELAVRPGASPGPRSCRHPNAPCAGSEQHQQKQHGPAETLGTASAG